MVKDYAPIPPHGRLLELINLSRRSYETIAYKVTVYAIVRRISHIMCVCYNLEEHSILKPFVTYSSTSSSYSINTLVLSLPIKDLIFIG